MEPSSCRLWSALSRYPRAKAWDDPTEKIPARFRTNAEQASALVSLLERRYPERKEQHTVLPVGSLDACQGGLDGLYDMSGNVWEVGGFVHG